MAAPFPTGPTGPAYFGPTGAWSTGPTSMTGGTGARANADVTYLIDRARIELPGASQNMVWSKTTEALHEFFSDSNIWTEYQKGELIPNVTSYWVDPQENPPGEIIRLAGIYDSNGFPIGGQMINVPVVTLTFMPNNEQTVTMMLIKTIGFTNDPNVPPNNIPYWVIKEYMPYLLAGILYKCQMQKNKSYTDMESAKINYVKFREGVNNARVAALRNNTFGTNAWCYPQNWRSNTQRGGVSVGNNYNQF